MIRCPACGSSRVHRSQSKNATGGRRRLFTVWVRCHQCSRAFRRVDWRRAGLAGAVVAALAVGPWVLLRARSPSPSPPATDRLFEGPPTDSPYLAGREPILPEVALIEAATRGDNDARCRLGLARLQEFRATGEQSSLTDALRWLKAAAESGDPRAQLQLGIMHQDGSGLIEDYVEAARWLRQAALRGSAEAMVRLGGMALAGEGAPKDPVEAYVWLNLAAARGDRSADQARDRVRALLDGEQLAAAQNRSRVLDREVPRP